MWRSRLIVLLVLGSLGTTGCAARRVATPASLATPLSCHDDAIDIEWSWDQKSADRPALNSWCAGVGPPVKLQGTATSIDVRRLVVISWNVHVGGGRVLDLLTQLRAQLGKPTNGDVGFVLLLQETFRRGDAVPDPIAPDTIAPAAITPIRPAHDVIDLARATGYSLAYVPSMRNGRGTPADREDRGVAILSSEPLEDVVAIELPLGHQRRVALAATVDPAGMAMPMRVVSGHFDILRGTAAQARRLADYLEMNGRGMALVAGIDTNAIFGSRSGSVRMLDRVVPRLRECGGTPTNRWLARIDFLFSSVASSQVERCQTSVDTYGSDHAPLVLTLDLDRD